MTSTSKTLLSVLLIFLSSAVIADEQARLRHSQKQYEESRIQYIREEANKVFNRARAKIQYEIQPAQQPAQADKMSGSGDSTKFRSDNITPNLDSMFLQAGPPGGIQFDPLRRPSTTNRSPVSSTLSPQGDTGKVSAHELTHQQSNLEKAISDEHLRLSFRNADPMDKTGILYRAYNALQEDRPDDMRILTEEINKLINSGNEEDLKSVEEWISALPKEAEEAFLRRLEPKDGKNFSDEFSEKIEEAKNPKDNSFTSEITG